MARDDDDRDNDRDDDRPAKRTSSGKTSAGIGIGLILGILAGLLILCVIPFVAILIGLLLPAVSKVREAAGRANDQNNMKQIALAAHSCHDVYGVMAGPYHKENGKDNTGLSWRVSLLPYIEQESVYRMMDRTVAWNAPANQAATNLAIQTYKSAWDKSDPSSNTPYKAFVGPGTMFDTTPGARPLNFANVMDGTSNTIMYIHAQDQVPWAAPQDIAYGPGIPLPKFGHKSGPTSGYNVCMADGSVRFMTSTTSEATLRAMITRAAGD